MDPTILHSALAASGVIGAWTHDHAADRLTLAGHVITLIGLDPVDAARGVPLATFLDRAHPEDRVRAETFFDAVVVMDAPVEAEFRLRDRDGGMLALSLRGRAETDASGQRVRGNGIAIDRTDEQPNGLAEATQIVNRMAAQAITLRGLAQSLQRPSLVERVDCLMIGIGYELARLLPEEEDVLRH
ncbi:PAS domain-containing protein [Methylobacterium aerolatum]|uniref:PAS fold-3 domain-containing protein n=1 Tax=Methylobacterium aerolatum TaxID=418708 RepID=A0ABU0I1P1_9HYPH|nr:PAS domain-containing protein [Methylobacterium aerolatum]MDQ0447835.1 hypothetical protein [Methylobacterium aerolatum]GJD34456.1 hypothetical protein FMGBMHLM_1356 [Methylobacterium aerolatum]